MSKNLRKIKPVAVNVARQAGKLLLGEYKKFSRQTVKLKAKHEIVTKADLISERTILREIRKNFPKHEILSEEAGKNGKTSDYLWVVDPLDGTTNFSIHNPLWAVSIGVAYKAEVVFGVVYAPYLDELFVAEKGKGAKLNNKSIKVSTEKQAKTTSYKMEEEARARECRLFRIEGRVQGAFFRESTRRRAEPLGITGYAKNMADGSVQVLACGEPDALNRLTEWLKEGPPMAEVERLDWIDSASKCPESFAVL